MTLERMDNNWPTQVAPGQVQAIQTFKLTNLSNATLDFSQAVSIHASGTTTIHGTIDNFNTVPLSQTVYADTNGNGIYDSGIDLEEDFVDELAPDTAHTFFYAADIPLSLPNGSASGNNILVGALEGGVAGTKGEPLTQTTGANTTGVDTVFNDPASPGGDVARNRFVFAQGSYLVATADLIVTRSSKVISDPVNNTVNPKAIPSALVEFCVAIANNGGMFADDVTISETLPANLTWDSSFGLVQGGTVTDGTCNADGTAVNNPYDSTSRLFTGTISRIDPAMLGTGLSVKTFRYRATIN